jgi:predicted lipoprotein with Yx(FWY)xxD motif
MQFRNTFQAIIGILFIMFSAISCKKSSNQSNTPSGPVINVQLGTDANLGKILTDSGGRTLYFFSNDADGASACTGDCLTTWPVFNSSTASLGTGLVAADFGSITRGDGSKQTTYKGWPLYYFDGDSKSGNVNGEGVGGIWFVAKPDYTVMLANGQLVGNDGISYDSTLTPGTGKTLYLTDDRGATLYSFKIDKFNTNNYTSADFSNDGVWPIDQVGVTLTAPSTINKSLLATITVFGKTQLVFNGWPMYYFGLDAGKRGSTKGVSFPAVGVWPVVNQRSAVAPQ